MRLANVFQPIFLETWSPSSVLSGTTTRGKSNTLQLYNISVTRWLVTIHGVEHPESGTVSNLSDLYLKRSTNVLQAGDQSQKTQHNEQDTAVWLLEANTGCFGFFAFGNQVQQGPRNNTP